jgi:hypothetical protein
MRREVVVKRGWLLMSAVVLAVLLSGALVIRELDINRIEAENLRTQEATIKELRKTTRVLCQRGNTLIDLVNAALILVGQRLEADVKAGNVAAVHADQRFLTTFLRDRERLIREQTGGGPCAPRS